MDRGQIGWTIAGIAIAALVALQVMIANIVVMEIRELNRQINELERHRHTHDHASPWWPGPGR